MLIVGLRHKIVSEIDSRRSSLFTRYLMHFLQMFAFLGVIFPVLIGVDYYSAAQTKNEVVKKKHYKLVNHINHIEYYIKTDSYDFLFDIDFYEKTAINDQLTFYLTPIFKTITKISHKSEDQESINKPDNIYGWPLIVVGLTFICSVIMIIRLWGWTKKRDRVNYDSVVNLGVINGFLCIIVIIFIFLYHIIR